MEICTCGSMLLPKREGAKKVMQCSGCGYRKEASMKLQDAVIKNKSVDVVDQKDNDMQHPLTDKECEKCGHGQSYWWITQTRASDEPATRFFKCEKCKHTWREY